MPLVTNTAAGNFLVDGAYVSLVPAQPVTPVGPATGLIANVGTGNWGKTQFPLPYSDSQSLIQQFGNDTVSAHSLVRESLNEMPECQQFLGVRVTNGTDIAAQILLLDAVGGTVEDLIAVFTGSYPNGVAGLLLTLTSGDTSGVTGVPIYSATVFFPNQNAQTFTNIVAGTTGAYVASVFHANFKAAINGTVPNKAGSSFFTDVNGASSLPPRVGVVFLATGGTDGSAGITTGQMIGADSATGGMGTGIYSLRTMVQAAQVVVSALTDPTVGQALNTFAVQENCIVWMAFPSNTPTYQEQNTIQANNLVADSLFLASDWDYIYDNIQQQTVLTSPIGKLAGLIAAQPTWQYPGNQAAEIGVTATDRINNGTNTINSSEQAQREQAGILYLGYMPQAPRGPALGLPHAMTSTGRLISDIRMTKSIAYSLLQLLGKYVGGMMNPYNANSLTIKAVNDAIDGYFQNLLAGQTPQIAAYQNITNSSNNTFTTITQGFIISAIAVTTLSAARFILAFVQVGNTVQVVIQTAPGA